MPCCTGEEYLVLVKLSTTVVCNNPANIFFFYYSYQIEPKQTKKDEKASDPAALTKKGKLLGDVFGFFYLERPLSPFCSVCSTGMFDYHIFSRVFISASLFSGGVPPRPVRLREPDGSVGTAVG